MKKFLSFFRSGAFALLLAAALVSCNKSGSHSDNAFRNRLAELNWGDGVCYSEERLGRKNAFMPTVECFNANGGGRSKGQKPGALNRKTFGGPLADKALLLKTI